MVVATAATVSVNRTGPPMLVAPGRGPVVAPGAGWFGRGDVEELLAGGWIVRSQGLAALDVGRRCANCCVDDWRRGLGNHAGGANVVGHIGTG